MKLHSEHLESWMSRVNSTWGFGLAVSMGLEDSVNVNTLSFTLLFFFFLVYIVRTRINVIICGIICITIQLMMLTSMIYGKFDFILSKDSVYLYVKIACGISALIFMMVGLIYFRDWWQVRFNENKLKSWIRMPVFGGKQDNSESFFILSLFISLFYWIVSAVFGAGIIFLSAYAVQDYNMFIMLVDSISKEQFQKGQKAVFIYTATFLIPILIFWLISILYCFSENFRKYVERSILIIKLILCSIFICAGVGLLVTFYKM